MSDIGTDEDSEHNLFSEDDTDNDVNYNPDDDGSSGDSSGELKTTQEKLQWRKLRKQEGKKRTARCKDWARQRAKKARNEGKEYIDRRGKMHEGKNVKEYNHNCRYKCNLNVTENLRKNIFDAYWKLGEWNLQTSFLSSSVTLNDTKRSKEGASYIRNKSCTYTLQGHRVCKTFFMLTLDISNKRLSNVVSQKSRNDTSVPCTDRRGKKVPTNKIPTASVNLIKDHIKSIPKYVSHYTRVKSPNIKYLSPNLSLSLLYNMYVEFCAEKHAAPEKKSFYTNIFKTSFNLSFKKPLTDTCDKCDTLQSSIDYGDENASNKAKIEKEVHLRKSEVVKHEKTKDVEETRNNSSKVVVCFDLQKTLATPSLTCKKAYYCRQLWTYNLCIHNLVDNQAHMYTWHEGQGSRGCQEIASCLLKFIHSLPCTVKHITVYSDNCAGQNKSHYIVKLWHYITLNTQIETVDHKFFVVGHSYMECDQDFGVIEKAKKKNGRDIFVPSQWSEIISKASKKFIVSQMKDDDFINLDSLSPFFKKTVKGISKMQWLHLKKQNPFILYYKESFAYDDFSQMNTKVAKCGRHPTAFPTLQPTLEKPRIKESKYNDLQSLLPYIPPIYHTFYQTLLFGNSNTRLQVTNDQVMNEVQEEPDNLYESDYE